jgi:HTH-type transcriptional regulator, sugar sensing transcriptional regulator
MIVQQNFIKKLKDFGLNSYEAKIWTALLSRGVSSAGELSDIANVPRSRAYDILESLEKKGFIMMKLGKPIKYIAIPPTEVIERVKKKVKEDLIYQEKTFEELKKSEVLNELTQLHTKGIDMVDPTDISGSLKSRDSIYNHLDYMIGNAESEIVLVTSTEGLKRKHSYFAKSLRKAKEKGVSIKIAAPFTKETENLSKELKGVAELRHLDALKSRFCIVDKKDVLFMLTDDKDVHQNYDFGVWLSTPYLAGAVNTMFDGIWKGAKKL